MQTCSSSKLQALAQNQTSKGERATSGQALAGCIGVEVGAQHRRMRLHEQLAVCRQSDLEGGVAKAIGALQGHGTQLEG